MPTKRGNTKTEGNIVGAARLRQIWERETKMLTDDIIKLCTEYGPDIEVTKAVHLMDEYEWNEVTVSYMGIIVGSELVPYELMRKNVEEIKMGK